MVGVGQLIEWTESVRKLRSPDSEGVVGVIFQTFLEKKFFLIFFLVNFLFIVGVILQFYILGLPYVWCSHENW